MNITDDAQNPLTHSSSHSANVPEPSLCTTHPSRACDAAANRTDTIEAVLCLRVSGGICVFDQSILYAQ